jgi:hypothetical protein
LLLTRGFFIENERLPVKLGWHRTNESVSNDDIANIFERIINATASSPGQMNITVKRDMHSGLY